MSDKLSKLLQKVENITLNKIENPDQKIIKALEKALKTTTPTHAGCPWDDEDKKEQIKGGWIPEGD